VAAQTKPRTSALCIGVHGRCTGATVLSVKAATECLAGQR